MIKSSLFNYELPKSSINQIPYQNPLDSKLLIAESKKIVYFKTGYRHLHPSQHFASVQMTDLIEVTVVTRIVVAAEAP